MKNTSQRVGRKSMSDYKERGHRVQIHVLGPDLLVYVDGTELSPFYPSLESARNGASRYIDEVEKENHK